MKARSNGKTSCGTGPPESTNTRAVEGTTRRLNAFLPTTFPRAIAESPFKLKIDETASSGALVPKATTVKPITTGEMRADMWADGNETETVVRRPVHAISDLVT